MGKYKIADKKSKKQIRKEKMEKAMRTPEANRRYELMVNIGFYAVTVIYGILCLYLHYMQSVMPVDGRSTTFESDLPYHISMIVDDGWFYSLTAYVYMALYKLASDSTVLIAIFLALTAVATILLTEKALRALGVKNKGVSCGGAFVLNLVPSDIRLSCSSKRFITL